mmetsp:Transcript_50785/g.84173  ORF Transcript_50785/g.84173 Transcript_50785/m.84173 type:complete len:398 (+) Transcript_50785:1396-2589(+)
MTHCSEDMQWRWAIPSFAISSQRSGKHELHSKKSREHHRWLIELIKAGATVAEIKKTSDLALSALDGIAQDLLDDHSVKVGLAYLLSQQTVPQVGPERFHFCIDHCGNFTMANYVAVSGHLHLVKWLLLPWSGINIDRVLRMLMLSVRHSIVSEQSLEVQHLLLDCLATHGVDLWHVSVSDLDYDDVEQSSQHDTTSASSNLLMLQESLLDVAINGLLKALSCYGDDRLQMEHLIPRCWATVQLLTKMQPALPFFSSICSSLSSGVLMFPRKDPEKFVAACEPHVLGLLQLCASLGQDMTALVWDRKRNEKPMTMSQVLVAGGWIGSLAWLVEQHGINVQGLSMTTCFWWSDNLIEWTEVLSRRLATIQARQLTDFELKTARCLTPPLTSTSQSLPW